MNEKSKVESQRSKIIGRETDSQCENMLIWKYANSLKLSGQQSPVSGLCWIVELLNCEIVEALKR